MLSVQIFCKGNVRQACGLVITSVELFVWWISIAREQGGVFFPSVSVTAEMWCTLLFSILWIFFEADWRKDLTVEITLCVRLRGGCSSMRVEMLCHCESCE